MENGNTISYFILCQMSETKSYDTAQKYCPQTVKIVYVNKCILHTYLGRFSGKSSEATETIFDTNTIVESEALLQCKKI